MLSHIILDTRAIIYKLGISSKRLQEHQYYEVKYFPAFPASHESIYFASQVYIFI